MLLLVIFGSALLPCVVTSSCTANDDTCEFWLEVSHKMTMMVGQKAVFAENGKLYRVDAANRSSENEVDPINVVVADGFEGQRLIATVNGRIPGPPIIVYENQMVKVHVTNHMTSSALTIHWHGLHQIGSPWMDGVAFITQCPILPHGTFTYEFKAYPRGTFWYHSHIGTQLSQGVVGAFIIKERDPPVKMDEHIIFLQDWNHIIEAELMHLKAEYGNFENRKEVRTTESLEGGHFSMFPMHSGLINGKGRYHHEDGTHTQSPLTVFEVQEGQRYRFRIIGGGSLYPFRVSIDGHDLKVIASDGFDLDPIVVESLIINPGERYDVEILANQTVGNYWVRAFTLEVNVTNHIAEAIMRYTGAPIAEPQTTRKQCTQTDRCLVLNCPFSYYATHPHTDCVRLDEVKSLVKDPAPGAPGSNDEIEDIFLNFAFPGETHSPASTNGRRFKMPPVSALTQPQELTDQCDPTQCGQDKICTCAYSLDLEHNKVYQMVFLNMGKGKGWAHPIHMHGHSFYVVKMGYPQYDKITGKIIGDNLDIDCRGNPNREKSYCNNATWANRSWGGNAVPGLELEAAPRKDTIIVPTGGYVVVRIRADNPGVWFMHCHIEQHNIEGMAVMLNESFPNHPSPPTGFHVCGNFESGKKLIRYEGKLIRYEESVYTKTMFWAVVGPHTGVTLILCCCCIYLGRRVYTAGK